MLRKASIVFDLIISTLENIAAIASILLVLVITLHVFFRYVLNNPFNWTTQFASYSLLLFVCLCTTQLLKIERHVTIDIFISTLNPRIRNLIHFITSILGILLCIVIVLFGISATAEQAIQNILVMDDVQFPQYFITIFIPFTFCILGIQFIRRTYGFYIKWRNPDLYVGKGTLEACKGKTQSTKVE